MSVIDDQPRVVQLPPIRIPFRSVLRRLGSSGERRDANPEMERIYRDESERADSLIHPQGVYRLLKVSSRESGLIHFLNHPFVIRSRQVQKMLRKSDPVCFFMVTIGPQVEETVRRLFDEGEMVSSIVLDAIGSETADAVADHLHRVVLKASAEKAGYTITPRYSPGYGDWPVTVQGELLEICKGESIGISVNASSFMVPRKSVSAVLGWMKK
ncbi:hypothetical protein JW824_14255 [bacterium]|nr:hypothetical protein [bacterium]